MAKSRRVNGTSAARERASTARFRRLEEKLDVAIGQMLRSEDRLIRIEGAMAEIGREACAVKRDVAFLDCKVMAVRTEIGAVKKEVGALGRNGAAGRTGDVAALGDELRNALAAVAGRGKAARTRTKHGEVAHGLQVRGIRDRSQP
jgi:hypothetical protein